MAKITKIHKTIMNNEAAIYLALKRLEQGRITLAQAQARVEKHLALLPDYKRDRLREMAEGYYGRTL